ncbi:Hypothetical predicted protein [Mytilus galloprovincialis]|uniref:CCHC-type domain-containing protein n=1 Tax=Mytilus galloprovincialis TaxID=29158 RepID=A0A8B6HDQ3_MYTGA|nr:Hypothetical predicted protein [Mytilus galloprovincialis]
MNGLKADLKTIVMTKEPKNIEEFRHAANLAEKAIDSNVNSLNSMNQTVLNEIHSLREHIQTMNVNSPTTTQNQSYQPPSNPPNTVYVQQPVYQSPRVPNQPMHQSNRFRSPQNQYPRQRFNRMPPRQPYNQNFRQPIRYQDQSQTSFQRCSYCNGFCQNRSYCPARGVVCHMCNKIGHFAKACSFSRRMQTQ